MTWRKLQRKDNTAPLIYLGRCIYAFLCLICVHESHHNTIGAKMMSMTDELTTL